MLCTAPTLRTAVLGCRIQPTLLAPCTYHTTAPTPGRSQDSSLAVHQRVPLIKRNASFKPTSAFFRNASSVSSSTSSESASSIPQSTSTTLEKLDWNTFFKLRKTRRWYQLGSSVGTSLGGFVTGVQVLTRSDMDALVGQIPLDPFITLGLITFTCGGVGWLVGPILGTGIFNLRNRKYKGQMEAKEKEFYARVKKYRVDPSVSSMANPVPDFYGEKVSSVQGYRQWLKDQRAFNKKRQTYV